MNDHSKKAAEAMRDLSRKIGTAVSSIQFLVGASGISRAIQSFFDFGRAMDAVRQTFISITEVK